MKIYRGVRYSILTIDSAMDHDIRQVSRKARDTSEFVEREYCHEPSEVRRRQIIINEWE